MTSSNISANKIKPRVQLIDEGRGDSESYQQLELPFDVPESYHQPELPFDGVIECHGGMRPDPLEGSTLTDVRAYAMDPDPDVRMLAAASRMNWDRRVQLQLATDDDERVVLALLDHVDPFIHTCHVVIDGPHIAARRQLAGRNLVTPLLERLASDTDPLTAETAQQALARRSGGTAEPAVTK